MDAFFSRPMPSWDNLKAASSLSPVVRSHLQKVYGNLATMFGISGVTAYLHTIGLIKATGLSHLVAIGALLYFTFTPSTPSNAFNRKAALYAFSAAQGLSLAPLIRMAIYVTPGAVTTALVSTSLVFVSFSISALYSNRRSVLYMGGMLMSFMSTLFWIGLANMFLNYKILYNAELYLGLILFCGFVMYDTQVIVFKCESGSRDYLAHSVDLYIDFIQIFVRVLAILMKRREEDERRERKKKRRQ